jgi:hypothetical protein
MPSRQSPAYANQRPCLDGSTGESHARTYASRNRARHAECDEVLGGWHELPASSCRPTYCATWLRHRQGPARRVRPNRANDRKGNCPLNRSNSSPAWVHAAGVFYPHRPHVPDVPDGAGRAQGRATDRGPTLQRREGHLNLTSDHPGRDRAHCRSAYTRCLRPGTESDKPVRRFAELASKGHLGADDPSPSAKESDHIMKCSRTPRSRRSEVTGHLVIEDLVT